MKIGFEVENLCEICYHFLCGACGCPYNDLVICKDSSDCLSLGNEILQEISDAKYLGIQIDNKLDWNKHDISTVAARGQSKLAFLNRNLKGCPKKLRDTAYISLIRPALEYSCSVWHPHNKK